MKRRTFTIQCVGLVALLYLGGCSSTPNPNFYTLDMQPSESVEPRINIEVDRLRPSEAVARDGIMILKSPTEIEYYAIDRWVSNVGEMVKEKLHAEFGPPVAGRETVLIGGEILRFGQVDTDAGADAEIKLFIMAVDAGDRRGEPLLRQTYSTRVTADSAAAKDVVGALSQGLETIAAEIADDVFEAYRAGEPGR